MSWSSPKFMFIVSVILSSHLILWYPLLLLPWIFPRMTVFSNDSALHIKWPKYWSFSFSTSPSSEYSGLTSLKVDWFDLLAVQGTFRSLLEHHSSKASILWHSAFFMVQLSQPYMTTGTSYPSRKTGARETTADEYNAYIVFLHVSFLGYSSRILAFLLLISLNFLLAKRCIRKTQ